MENGNRYQYVGGNVINGADPSGMLDRRQIEEGNAQYSCHCGWIDWSHATPPDQLVQNVRRINQLVHQYNLLGIHVHLESKQFGIGPVFDKKAIIPNLQEIDQATQMALAAGIWMSTNWRFEELQGAFHPYLAAIAQGTATIIGGQVAPGMDGAPPTKVFSGIAGWAPKLRGFQRSAFSEEDLVSDLIGVYRALTGTTQDQIRDMCSAFDDKESIQVWENTYGTGSHDEYSNEVISMHTTGESGLTMGEGWRHWYPRLLTLLDCQGNIDTSHSALGECNRSTRRFPRELEDIANNAIPPLPNSMAQVIHNAANQVLESGGSLSAALTPDLMPGYWWWADEIQNIKYTYQAIGTDLFAVTGEVLLDFWR